MFTSLFRKGDPFAFADSEVNKHEKIILDTCIYIHIYLKSLKKIIIINSFEDLINQTKI